ncbi:SDR family NAD(P)-dependent oxidoreductase [Streptomyces hydrogenans]|uniref:SDR family NAD(P)-dependent oxidoreductase n=3 Tax=Streptomyces hydrogenans TaxID=1873719 RepID=UPI00364A19F3
MHDTASTKTAGKTMKAKGIAIVGMACRYPDATSPQELWENALAGRRAFRQIPRERMNMADYYSADPSDPDRIPVQTAAVIEGYEFDRVRFKVAGSTFRNTDLTHWLALDIADQALRDAGFSEGDGLPRATTGVVIGNTLTGEFSRANLMRIRWPYVQRTVASTLKDMGWAEGAIGELLTTLEERYKQPFPVPDEDMLAGGLSNTIAGRICNHFDLHGGGYTVDGACSSSLLSVVTAANALSSGELDVAIAGGVDLSIDPFETIGFARTGALATGDLRVYDRDSKGIWLGEGCGMVVLMRAEDAVAQGRRIYAHLAGWGVASDGRGGITRPLASGHQLALERAYTRAGFGLGSVSYIEGHGTGTAVGDATELRAISEARRASDPTAPAAAISTIKGNIGHTKAAAGVAGLIKATLAVHHRVIPPATSHRTPHPELLGDQPMLRVPTEGEPWPEGMPVRAGVSAMGFGGINTHVVLDVPGAQGAGRLAETWQPALNARQDAELLLVDASGMAQLRDRLSDLAALVPQLAEAQLGDLAGDLQQRLEDRRYRAAVVAGDLQEARRAFERLVQLIDGGAREVMDADGGVFLGRAGATSPSVLFLFPGQGSGQKPRAAALERRFPEVAALYADAPLPHDGNQEATAVAQPRIVTAELAGLHALDRLGIEGQAAMGHSLGELTALHWAGAWDADTLLHTAAVRGRVMTETTTVAGAMISVMAGAEAVEELLREQPVVLAGLNGPRQTVVAGAVDAVLQAGRILDQAGLSWMRVPVSHAFHSPLMEAAAEELAAHLTSIAFQPLTRRVLSTVTGRELTPETSLRDLLRDQVVQPVRFAEALEQALSEADLVLEVGPGRVLSKLTRDMAPDIPVIPLETDSDSLAGILRAAGAGYVLGAHLQHAALFHGRLLRPLPSGDGRTFFSNPCEAAPGLEIAPVVVQSSDISASPAEPVEATVQAERIDQANTGDAAGTGTTLDVLRRLAAERAELPLDVVLPQSNPLDDLHLSSITVGQLISQTCRELGLAVPLTTTSFATATLEELAAMLDAQSATDSSVGDQPAEAAGVGSWVRPFAIDYVEASLPRQVASGPDGQWQIFAPDNHPLAEELRSTLPGAGLGHGVLVCLPPECSDDEAQLALEAAKTALAAEQPTRFAVIQHGYGGAGMAKTLHLESPAIPTCVINIPAGAGSGAVEDIARRVIAEIGAVSSFTEVQYDEDGTRRVPILRPLAQSASEGVLPLGPDDVIMVTGGGKGITAECALSLARETGARLGLVGRSAPEDDVELAANLERMTAAGIQSCYVQADVTSGVAVKRAVDEVVQRFGPVTAVIHGAGRNMPRALESLDANDLRRTLAPKTAGLKAVLDAVDTAKLRLLVSLGSIIGRAGLRGEADYATANEWLSAMTQRVGRELPRCRAISLEWSVWSGAGMGERLGVVESLRREGIEPIPTDQGLAVLRQVLADPHCPDVVVISGRATSLPTITFERRELPLLRFTERPLVHYPRIELVTEAELSPASDLYLEDHLLDGDLLFPAVVGMEAMVQVANAVTARNEDPILRDVEFLRPIVAQPTGTTIRVAALVSHDDRVDVVIRSSETGFLADHFKGTVLYPSEPLRETVASAAPDAPPVSLEPKSDLYGPVLFQGDRFQRVAAYRGLSATQCEVELEHGRETAWFGRFLPQDLLLGDPGTRDACMHAIQCCVPDATLLPEGIDNLHIAAADMTPARVVITARERERDGDRYVYDLDVRDLDGRLRERWHGLRLRAVRKQDGRGPWAPALLGPFLERNIREIGGQEVSIAVEPNPRELAGVADRRAQTARTLSRAVGRTSTPVYRPDGKPELTSGQSVSASHGAGVTLAIATPTNAGCDVEQVTGRPLSEWKDLLGASWNLCERLAESLGEDIDLAATRVWSAMESVRKAGVSIVDSMVLQSADQGWVRFTAGMATIHTFATTTTFTEDKAVFAILTMPEAD